MFAYGGLTGAPTNIMAGATETFGRIDVVIPPDFEGTFALTLVEDVRINDDTLFNNDLANNWIGTENPALANTSYAFSVTSVPEPTSFLMLSLIGCSAQVESTFDGGAKPKRDSSKVNKKSPPFLAGSFFVLVCAIQRFRLPLLASCVSASK